MPADIRAMAARGESHDFFRPFLGAIGAIAKPINAGSSPNQSPVRCRRSAESVSFSFLSWTILTGSPQGTPSTLSPTSLLTKSYGCTHPHPAIQAADDGYCAPAWDAGEGSGWAMMDSVPVRERRSFNVSMTTRQSINQGSRQHSDYERQHVRPLRRGCDDVQRRSVD